MKNMGRRAKQRRGEKKPMERERRSRCVEMSEIEKENGEGRAGLLTL